MKMFSPFPASQERSDKAAEPATPAENANLRELTDRLNALQKQIDIPTTIRVPQGAPVQVSVARDLDFSGVASR